jgi:hypothetical protein
MSAQSRVQLADWLKTNHPALFQRAIRVAENATNNGLGQMGPSAPAPEPTKSFWEKFTEAAAGLGTTYLTLKNQRDAMKINLDRAQQGLPPIDAGTSAPVITTQVALSPELTNRLVSTAGEGLNKMLLFGAAAVAAFFLFR